jgi:hypothetical protein
VEAVKFIYINHSMPEDRVYNGLPPHEAIFECDVPSILEADKLFAEKFGFKMSDKRAAHISTQSPSFYGGIDERYLK